MWNAWLTFYYYYCYCYVRDRRCEQSRSSDSKGQSIKGWNEMIWFGVAMCFFDLSRLAVCLVSGGRHAFFCLGLWPQSNQTWRILPQVFIHVFNLAKNLMTDFWLWFFFLVFHLGVGHRQVAKGRGSQTFPRHGHQNSIGFWPGTRFADRQTVSQNMERNITFSIFFFLLLFAISIVVTFVQNKNTAD